jgi:hypothetical protein
MKKTKTTKLGVDKHEEAIRPRVLDDNNAQSRDVHEDRGAIQSHLGRRQKQLTPRPKRP